MKIMIISDIHGDTYALDKVLSIYSLERCSKLLILGDLFNYDFDLSRDIIIDDLNSMKQNIICVRGNCDYNINDLLFDMPYITNYDFNNKLITLTHGHLYDKEYLMNLDSNIIITGHTHIAKIDKIDNKILLNPGSISKSRIRDNSFIIMDEKEIILKDVNNNLIKKINY